MITFWNPANFSTKAFLGAWLVVGTWDDVQAQAAYPETQSRNFINTAEGVRCMFA